MIASYIDGPALWRLYFSHLNLPGSAFYCFAGRPSFELITGHDIVIVQRMCLQTHMDFLKICKQLGLKIVMDLDDNVWELPEYNPAKKVFDSWGEGFKACLKMVDAISVSTPELEKAVRKHAGPLQSVYHGKDIPVFQISNKIDERVFAPVVQRKEKIIGWSGSSSHIGDLVLIEDALLQIKEMHPDVAIEFRGCQPSEKLKDIVRHKTWSPVPEFCSRMPTWGWDIALAPLTDHNFNQSKTAIKVLESAYCHIPTLMSDVKPYGRFASKDKALQWLLCDRTEDWVSKLHALLTDDAKRVELGEKSYQVMHEHHSWQSGPHEGWQRLFNHLNGL
jgi:glycosyltransferase involved in cell wall biosynthesis